MSKRSSRRKRRQQKQKQEAKLTGPVLTRRGLTAFNQANYDAAIADWEQAQHKKDAPPKLNAALAEAYFRRAVVSPNAGLSDLKQAVRLRLDVPRYQYHLGLAHHRLGDLDQAEPIYRNLLAASPPYERAAQPLAQLLIDKGTPLAKDGVWERLAPPVRTQLTAAEALVRQKATSTLEKLAQTDLQPLWQGFIALALGEVSAAQNCLQAALDTDDLPPGPAGVVNYYLGVIAAKTGRVEAAEQQWRTAQAQGFATDALRRNLGLVTYRQLLAEQQAGRQGQALELLDQINRPRSIGVDPVALRRQLNWEAADAAAQKGDWEQALAAWQTVENLGDDSRGLSFNLALALQKSGRHWEAAEQWRALLRRRPRKPDHPDYLSDEQVVRIWQNVADNYGQAGDYEEAITTYKTAIKWGPNNLDLRMRLVDALQAEGRWQAAENELNRILEKKPDHVPAMLALAESYADDYWAKHQARDLLLRALELEPQNPIARQQMAFFIEQESMNDLYWGRGDKALETLEEGLALLPNNQRLHLVMGTVYFTLQEFDDGRRAFEKALAVNPNDLQTLYTIFMSWLKADSQTDINQTLARIKAVPGLIPGDFFLDLIAQCMDFDRHDLANELIDFTEARYRDDIEVVLSLSSLFRELEQAKRALALVRHVIKDHPDHAEANIELGVIYFELDQVRLAKRHWQKAEEQAKKVNDQMLLYQIKTVRDVMLHGKQPPQSMGQILQQMPPELRQQMIEDAPPEIREMLRDMPPDMIDMLINAAMGGGELDPSAFIDDLFDFDDDEEGDDGWF
ncbi:MAG: tetratricopeptide repeat protein [Anaerolineae bacterium]|nr:tetratricopeptide repeat protein [Anaerolineae bacterium]